MNSQEQRKVAKAIAGAFLISSLAGGAITAANAETMATPPAAKMQSNAKGMMRHGCSSKSKGHGNGMMRHGCSSKGQAKTPKPSM